MRCLPLPKTQEWLNTHKSPESDKAPIKLWREGLDHRAMEWTGQRKKALRLAIADTYRQVLALKNFATNEYI